MEEMEKDYVKDKIKESKERRKGERRRRGQKGKRNITEERKEKGLCKGENGGKGKRRGKGPQLPTASHLHCSPSLSIPLSFHPLPVMSFLSQPLPSPARASLGTLAHITRFTYKSKHRYTRGSGSVFARVLSALGPTHADPTAATTSPARHTAESPLLCLAVLLSYPFCPYRFVKVTPFCPYH